VSERARARIFLFKLCFCDGVYRASFFCAYARLFACKAALTLLFFFVTVFPKRADLFSQVFFLFSQVFLDSPSTFWFLSLVSVRHFCLLSFFFLKMSLSADGARTLLSLRMPSYYTFFTYTVPLIVM
jgi:hypothetical protein